MSATISQTSTVPKRSRSDTINHYVKKADITRSIVEGVAVKALCGVTYVVNSRGGGQVHEGRARTCELCSLIYLRLP